MESVILAGFRSWFVLHHYDKFKGDYIFIFCFTQKDKKNYGYCFFIPRYCFSFKAMILYNVIMAFSI